MLFAVHIQGKEPSELNTVVAGQAMPVEVGVIDLIGRLNVADGPTSTASTDRIRAGRLDFLNISIDTASIGSENKDRF